MTAPAWGDLVPLTTDNWRDLPDTTTPYYVAAEEGTFLHRRTANGRGLVPHYKKVKKLKPVGHRGGAFQFDAAEVPASIYAQAVSFFRRIWFDHGTEAEVLITQHEDTKEYRLFVPTQRVSHGGVYSIYNPAHIAKGWMVVGTFHSHCNFSSHHSSTDEGDARDMDGLHGTIGYVDRETPELSLMVAVNGAMYHFTAPYDGTVNTNDLSAGSAPPWWDRYVLFGTITDADRPKIAPFADDETWDSFMGRNKKVVQLVPPKQSPSMPPYPSYHTPYRGSEDWTDWNWENDFVYDPKTRTYRSKRYGSELSNESARFNNRYGIKSLETITASDEDEEYWEDTLGSKYVDSLFDTGLFTDDDLDMAVQLREKSIHPEYWEQVFMNKVIAGAAWLREQGFSVRISIKDERPKQVPGQTTVDQHIAGAV